MSAEAMLTVEGLTVRAGDGRGEPVVDDVSFEVESGETYGLLGSSGSGKSTTARAILDLLPRGLARTEGRIGALGQELGSMGDPAWAQLRGSGIALIPQDPKASLVPVISVGQQMIALHRRHFGSSADAARRGAEDALERVYLPDSAGVLAAYPHELSGGMAQRVTIAMALMIGPSLLIADEPTTGLDVVLQFSVLELIQEAIAEQGTSIILISHDLGVIANYTNRLAVMDAGRIVEEGPTERVFDAPQHAYTRMLLEASTLDSELTELKPTEARR
jgi:ABC-type glutathione transport system ATPase component